ncbi:hypothetical protein PIB30_032339 [Stylosanthes scabra]|uniref:RNase H type-1 domain-containing protein n=1 Tax=Stylosanthes scabra TaxID=79078 RepID=A0ABU6SCC1_9FABA|nr:hypothetical protein [Stylosanthes scabra]
MALKITENFNKARLVDMCTSPTPQQPPPGALSAINWECPSSHLWKINVDAAVDGSNSMRIGAVIRDSLGQITTVTPQYQQTVSRTRLANARLLRPTPITSRRYRPFETT